MCEPATLLAISAASAAIGTGVSIYGQYQASQAATQQAKYKAQVARNNATRAEQAATRAREVGDIQAQEVRRKARALASYQRAAFGSAGVDVGSGSAAETIADTAALGELDALTIRANAEQRAVDFESQGENFTGEAAFITSAGQARSNAALTEAGATLVAGAGSVAGKWYDYTRIQ